MNKRIDHHLFIVNGIKMEDNVTLSSYGMIDHSATSVVHTMCGGVRIKNLFSIYERFERMAQ